MNDFFRDLFTIVIVIPLGWTSKQIEYLAVLLDGRGATQRLKQKGDEALRQLHLVDPGEDDQEARLAQNCKTTAELEAELADERSRNARLEAEKAQLEVALAAARQKVARDEQRIEELGREVCNLQAKSEHGEGWRQARREYSMFGRINGSSMSCFQGMSLENH